MFESSEVRSARDGSSAIYREHEGSWKEVPPARGGSITVCDQPGRWVIDPIRSQRGQTRDQVHNQTTWDTRLQRRATENQRTSLHPQRVRTSLIEYRYGSNNIFGLKVEDRGSNYAFMNTNEYLCVYHEVRHDKHTSTYCKSYDEQIIHSSLNTGQEVLIWNGDRGNISRWRGAGGESVGSVCTRSRV